MYLNVSHTHTHTLSSTNLVSSGGIDSSVLSEVELRIELVLDHSPVPHQTAIPHLLQWCGIERRHLHA